MRIIIILLLAFSIKTGVCQPRVYKIVPAPAEKKLFQYNELNIYETYQFDSLTFLLGWTQDTARGPRMVVINKAGGEVFSTIGKRESFYFRPTFYRSDNVKDPLIMLAESGTDYSWGNSVFTFMEDRFTYAGEIPVAAKGPEGPVNIAPFIKPGTDGETIEFNFIADKIILHPGTNRQMVMDSSHISYLYKDRQLRMNIK